MSRKVTKRERNASFPLEIPYRLVNMYSVKGGYGSGPVLRNGHDKSGVADL